MVAGARGRSGASHCVDPDATSAVASRVASGLATALPSAAVIATESVPSVGDTQLRSAEPSVTCWRYGVRANENAAVAGDPWPQVCMMAVRPSPRSAGGLLRSPVAVAPSWPETFAPTPQAAE